MHISTEELVDIEVEGRTFTVPGDVLMKDSERFRELLKDDSASLNSEMEHNLEGLANAIENITSDSVIETAAEVSRYMNRMLQGTRTSPPISPKHLSLNYLADLMVDKGLRCPSLIDPLFNMFSEIAIRTCTTRAGTLLPFIWVIDQRLETVLRAAFDKYCLGNSSWETSLRPQHSILDQLNPQCKLGAKPHVALAHMFVAHFNARIDIKFLPAALNIGTTIRLLLAAANDILEAEDRYPPVSSMKGNPFMSSSEPSSTDISQSGEIVVESMYIILSHIGRALWQEQTDGLSTELEQWMQSIRSMDNLFTGNLQVMISGLLEMHRSKWAELQDGETTCPTSPSSSRSSTNPGDLRYSPRSSAFVSRPRWSGKSSRKCIKLDDVTPNQFSALLTYYSCNGGYQPIFSYPIINSTSQTYSFPRVSSDIALDLLTIVNKYKFQHAVEFSTAIIESLSHEVLPPIEKICLVEKLCGSALRSPSSELKTYKGFEGAAQWAKVLELAYGQLVERENPITCLEAEKIGASTAAMIASRREARINAAAGMTVTHAPSTSQRTPSSSSISRNTGANSCRSRSRSCSRSEWRSYGVVPSSLVGMAPHANGPSSFDPRSPSPVPREARGFNYSQYAPTPVTPSSPVHMSLHPSSPPLFGARSPPSPVSSEAPSPKETQHRGTIEWSGKPVSSNNSQSASSTSDRRSRSEERTPSPSRPSSHPQHTFNASVQAPSTPDSLAVISTWEKFFMSTYVDSVPSSSAGSSPSSRTRSSSRKMPSGGGSSSLQYPPHESPAQSERPSRITESVPLTAVIATISRPTSSQSASSVNSTPSVSSIKIPRRSVSPRPIPPPHWCGFEHDTPTMTSTYYVPTFQPATTEGRDSPESPPDSPLIIPDLDTISIPGSSPSSSSPMTNERGTSPDHAGTSRSPASRSRRAPELSSMYWRPNSLSPASDSTEHSRASIINYPFWFSDTTMPEVDQVGGESNRVSMGSNAVESASAETPSRSAAPAKTARFYF